MSEQQFKIWCNNHFAVGQITEKRLLLERIGGHELLLFDSTTSGADGAAQVALLDADIAFGQPSRDIVLQAEKLQWIHLNSAGYTAFDRDDVKQALTARGAILTNSSAVYDEPCAQHLLAMILSLARGLPFALDAQRTDQSWRMHELRPKLRLLNEQTVLIYGFGAIARRLVELLAPLEMRVFGVRRRARGDENARIIIESEADQLLPEADHVVDILPDNGQTKHFFNRERLKRLKPTACFYNIGRGTTVDQDFLREQLNNRLLTAAYLDVTDPEPLPADNLLWTTGNCFITPHAAGGHSNEKTRQVQHFLDNLRRFEQGEKLVNRII